ncbi:hypothetical protein CRE_16951 [Caenorhabditis remanei]|uniref:F-box domain-containing protein n=1 Tax=Caenorhabditis remanei TaxID=31234 RepID=E3N2A3_CAERE|nr:hypothetical protein CRE_16951 [Caenorhabditis remanei]
MTTGLPLLRLPYLVLMPVLEQMEFKERISLSILSKRARMFVKLLKMECEHINLKLEHDRIEMKLFFDNCRGFEIRTVKVFMYIDKYQRHNYHYDMSFSCCPGRLPPMDYVLPIMDVTHCKSIKQLTIAEVPQWDTLPLLAKLPKIDEVIVSSGWRFYTLSYEDSLEKEKQLLVILRTVLPVSSAVNFSHRFQNPNHLQEILKWNLDSLVLKQHPYKRFKTFSLNDLLVTNANALELHDVTLNVKDLNRFFKLWMKKMCNP